MKKYDYYNNFYIARCDILFTSDRHFVKVPKGSLMQACGGGCFSNEDNSITLANITAINRKHVCGYDLRNDSERFIEMSNSIWRRTLGVSDELIDAVRNKERIVEFAKILDTASIAQIQRDRTEILNSIEALIKKL